jgi:uncharacterized protein
MTALLDTGFLLAVIDADDNLHSSCVEALQSESHPVLPEVVLPELSYLILRELGHSVLATSLELSLPENWFRPVRLPADLLRAADLLEKYAATKLTSSIVQSSRWPKEWV